MLSLVFSFTVSRAENTKTDIFYVNDVAIESKLDLSNGIYLNGVFVESESDVDLHTRDMLIPLRKVFEAVGCKVECEYDTRTFKITSDSLPK